MSSQWCAEQLHQKFDVDGDGQLDKAEVASLFEQAFKNEQLSEEEVALVHASLDLNGSGSLSSAERLL